MVGEAWTVLTSARAVAAAKGVNFMVDEGCWMRWMSRVEQRVRVPDYVPLSSQSSQSLGWSGVKTLSGR